MNVEQAFVLMVVSSILGGTTLLLARVVMAAGEPERTCRACGAGQPATYVCVACWNEIHREIDSALNPYLELEGRR